MGDPRFCRKLLHGREHREEILSLSDQEKHFTVRVKIIKHREKFHRLLHHPTDLFNAVVPAFCVSHGIVTARLKAAKRDLLDLSESVFAILLGFLDVIRRFFRKLPVQVSISDPNIIGKKITEILR